MYCCTSFFCTLYISHPRSVCFHFIRYTKTAIKLSASNMSQFHPERSLCTLYVSRFISASLSFRRRETSRRRCRENWLSDRPVSQSVRGVEMWAQTDTLLYVLFVPTNNQHFLLSISGEKKIRALLLLKMEKAEFWEISNQDSNCPSLLGMEWEKIPISAGGGRGNNACNQNDYYCSLRALHRALSLMHFDEKWRESTFPCLFLSLQRRHT